jgi:aconitase A
MSTTEIVKILKNLSKDIEQMKQTINSLVEADNKSEEMYKTLNAKLDLFKNLDSDSRENIADKKNDKKPTKPSFFKKIFLEEQEKYLNTLYTQDEIDAIYASDEVVKKKKDTDKAVKAAAIIYVQHIKGNSPEGRASAFESIYTQFYP